MSHPSVSKIVFVGAPSSGKSTLCKALSEQYHTQWVSEFGKEYWMKNQVNRRLTPEQLLEIAIEQNRGEEELLLKSDRFLFCDTNAMITATFARQYYGTVSPELYKLAQDCKSRYAHTFLCDIDIPYEDTWERSGEVYRTDFQSMILDDLSRYGIHYTLIQGSIDTRLDSVNSTLKKL